MNFTKSRDGIERATVMVPFRLSREDIEELKRVARKEKTPWRKWLEDYAHEGVTSKLYRIAEDGE